jgi:hypothetical protein
MISPRRASPTREIESRILALLRTPKRLTFFSLADRIPEYTWQDLFRALKHLQDQERIDLVALKWDYEVLLRTQDGACPNGAGRSEAGHETVQA